MNRNSCKTGKLVVGHGCMWPSAFQIWNSLESELGLCMGKALCSQGRSGKARGQKNFVGIKGRRENPYESHQTSP